MEGRGLALLRALFPSWRFFEDTGQFPQLFYRVGSGPWLDGLQGRPRTVFSIFLNPAGNFLFAGNSLVDQLISDIGDTPDEKLSEISGTVSYQLVKRFVRHQVGSVSGPEFQFKIVQDGEEILVSPVHSC